VLQVDLESRSVGPGYSCFIIAEVGVNHNGDVELAKRLIDAALEAGADAVKFQTFSAERLVTRDAPKAEYQLWATGRDESQFEMLQRLELSQYPFHVDALRRGVLGSSRRPRCLSLQNPLGRAYESAFSGSCGCQRKTDDSLHRHVVHG